jgi:hypothetical protein
MTLMMDDMTLATPKQNKTVMDVTKFAANVNNIQNKILSCT